MIEQRVIYRKAGRGEWVILRPVQFIALISFTQISLNEDLHSKYEQQFLAVNKSASWFFNFFVVVENIIRGGWAKFKIPPPRSVMFAIKLYILSHHNSLRRLFWCYQSPTRMTLRCLRSDPPFNTPWWPPQWSRPLGLTPAKRQQKMAPLMQMRE